MVNSNVMTFAAIHIIVQRSCGRAIIKKWRMYSLVDGTCEREVDRSDCTCIVRNYLPIDGVSSGRNVMAVEFQKDKGVKLQAVEVLPGSCVCTTRTSPYPLKIDVADRGLGGNAGDLVRVKYAMSSTGPHQVRDVQLTVVFEKSKLAIIGSYRSSWGRITGTVKGTVTFRVLKRGKHKVVLGATSNINDPYVVLSISPGTAKSWMSATWVFGIAVGLVAGGVAVGVGAWPRRSAR